MKTNSTFKAEARSALRGSWGKAAVATLLYVLLMGVFVAPSSYTTYKMQSYTRENLGHMSSLHQMSAAIQSPEYLEIQRQNNGTSSASLLLQVFILFPISLGFSNAFRKLLETGNNSLIHNTIHIAFTNYWHKVWGVVLTRIFIFLWTLLLIIPGIIKSYSYAMTPYILEENPELTANEAIDRSRYMMRGHKFDLFWLQLSFIGWFLLALLTAGIGFFWFIPYYETSQSAFYEEVKADYALNGGLA